MNPDRQNWERLAASARNAPDSRDLEAPYGFATRVAALAMSEPRSAGRSVEYFAKRAVGLACLLAVAAVAVNYSSPTRQPDQRTQAAVEDPIAQLVDIAS